MNGRRVVLADDHPLVLEGLARLLEDEGATVVARAGSAPEAVAAVQRERPDLLVLDLRMPEGGGLEVLRALASLRPRPAVLVVSAGTEPAALARALALGAGGLVLKESPPRDLLVAMRAVLDGKRWVDPSLAGLLPELPAGPEPAPLSAREREIAGLVAGGRRNRAIAERLGISEGTVKGHLHRIYEKLGIAGRGELAARAREEGWG